MRQAWVPTLASRQLWVPVCTKKWAKPSKKALTLKNPNEPFGEGISGVKKILKSAR